VAKTTGFEEIADLRRSITEPLRQTSDEIKSEFNKITATGFEPSGLIKPDATGSVYDQIAATSGVTATPPVMRPLASSSEASPGPAEATASVTGAGPSKRKPPARKAKAATLTDAAIVPFVETPVASAEVASVPFPGLPPAAVADGIPQVAPVPTAKTASRPAKTASAAPKPRRAPAQTVAAGASADAVAAKPARAARAKKT
jgi:sec-independent protein translocase protein TatB